MIENVARPDLIRLLAASRNAKQTEDKAKIYALLGLIDPVIQSLTVPDYSAPILEGFREFSRAVIKATRRLDIIWQRPSTKVSANDHPWVADWTTATRDFEVGFFRGNESFYAAADTKHRYETGDKENHLTCRGIKIDTIDGLGCNMGLQ